VSYILDALRRADAERQRGGVPGLHDQTGTLTPASGAAGQSPAAPANRLALGAGLAALLTLALAAAWWLGRGAANPAGGAVQASLPAALPAPDAGRPLSVAAPMPATAAAPAPALVPAVVQGQTPAPVRAPPAAPSPPPAVPAPALAAPVAMPMAASAPLPTRPAAAGPVPGAGMAPADAASDPVRPWASLPEAMRAAMPALAWSGVVFADRADQRLVVVNGQVAREGDQLATGLQLLQIRPKSVVMRWQGQRIELPL
jgi:general secretion pathway protein B